MFFLSLMESLRSLPVIENLLDESKYSEALEMIGKFPEMGALHIVEKIPHDISVSADEALVLSKLYLLQGDDEQCIRYACKCIDQLDSLDEFYRESICFRMMDFIRRVNEENQEGKNGDNQIAQHKVTDSSDININKVKEYILGIICNNEEDEEAFLGYLGEIGEFGLLKERILRICSEGRECKNFLAVLMEHFSEEMHKIFLELDIGRHSDFMIYKVNALIFEEKIDELKAFLAGLEWDKLYESCFYIEDTHKLKLELSVNDARANSRNIFSNNNNFSQADVKNPKDLNFNESEKSSNLVENSNLNDTILNADVLRNANLILSGEWKQEIMSNFMFRNSKTSFRFIESMIKARCPFISLCNSLMNAGTTNDTFYRNNKAIDEKEWVRFIEYSAIGMIHQDNISAFEILKELLPSYESSNGEPAALMALGMMNAGNCDKEAVDYLVNWLDSTNNEILFGACMGLGFCLLGSCEMGVYERLKDILEIDSTVAQESAVYAAGMIFSGSGNEDVLSFLHDVQLRTDFPRLKRVCGMAIAMINTCKEKIIPLNFPNEDSESKEYSEEEGLKDKEDSEYLKNEEDKEGLKNKEYLKNSKENYECSYTALLSLGLGFVATSNLEIIREILPFINDGDDDVKRAAVIAIGFIACEDPRIMDSCLVPLAQNHNFHVRAAAALALGMFNSGTGNESICNLLEAMLYDPVDLVRHNACLGAGFALQQMNPALIKNYKRILDKINQIIAFKNEPQCVKIGAAIGRAISEMGGRSAVFSVGNFSRVIELKRVIGAFLFTQSWYWYPLMCAISLCILPTPVYFFDKNLNETSHTFRHDKRFYDYLVKLPEVRRTRRFKIPKEDLKDTIIESPLFMQSGGRLTDMAREFYEIDCPIFFGDKKIIKKE